MGIISYYNFQSDKLESDKSFHLIYLHLQNI